MRIAFFDSGVGGLTVLKQALAALPNEEYLYYADTRNVPYGVKTTAEVRELVFHAVEFLVRQNIDALVVACNTATSAAIGDLRTRYAFPIIGMEPAVKPAVAKNTGKKILVCATSLTLNESKLDTLIAKLDTQHKVERLELDRLVTFAETFAFDEPAVRSYLLGKMAGVRWDQYETIVLGCTHFIFYRDLIQELAGPGISVIDGNAGTVRRLVQLVGARASTSAPRGPRIVFFSSGEAESPERVARLTSLLNGTAQSRST